METPAGGNRSRARHAPRGVAAAMVVWASLAATGVGLGEEIRVTAVEPSWSVAGLMCAVRTRGLPDPPSRETIESGLPSALTISFAVLDARGREQGGSKVDVRIEPDLWEGAIVVRSPIAVRRAAGVTELRALIERLGPFEVTPAPGLRRSQPLRLRARLTVHPLAPAEAQHVHDLFGSESGSVDADRREVSAGLGSLLRFFLGRRPRRTWAAEAVSAPFTLESLAAPRAAEER